MEDPRIDLLPMPARVTRLPGESPARRPDVTIVWTDASLGAEGYRLEVDAAAIRIAAADPAGHAHALRTLAQLATADGRIPHVVIEDRPRFAWRGLHLDVCRHFFPADRVREAIEWCAALKLNRFHWHLTEDQGWRLPVPAFPRLASVAAWRQAPGAAEPYGGMYTAEEIRALVRFAEERHVTIVPEIEMPGHARAALAAYPHLSCTGAQQPVPCTWGIFEDVFCAGNDEVFAFLRAVLEEVASLFPGPYIHIGGDEVPKDRWSACPRCRARMQQAGIGSVDALQPDFLRRVEEIVRSLGRTMIGWEEIAEGGAPPSAIVMSWKGIGAGIEAARAGHHVVMCPMHACYLDSYQGPRTTEPPAFPRDVPLEAAYAFDPVPEGLEAEAAARVLGGQACVWTEYMPAWSDVRRMVFPRLAAIAEVLWSGASPSGAADVRRRFAALAPRLLGGG